MDPGGRIEQQNLDVSSLISTEPVTGKTNPTDDGGRSDAATHKLAFPLAFSSPLTNTSTESLRRMVACHTARLSDRDRHL